MTPFEKIRAIAFDVDGVMTDGGLICFDDGNFIRVFDAKDSMALRVASLQGIKLAVITGGVSPSLVQRFKKCGVPLEDIYLHSRDKMRDFRRFCERHSLSPDEVLYAGDDLPDIPVVKAAGIGAAPCDAVPEILACADFVSSRPGGKGCIREICELVLKSRGKWELDIAGYEKMY